MIAQKPASVRLTGVVFDERGIGMDQDVIDKGRDLAIEEELFAVVVVGGRRGENFDDEGWIQ